MRPLNSTEIQNSFVNASRSETEKIVLPKDLDGLNWDRMDYLGWRDPKLPLRGYLVALKNGQPIGVVLRAPEGTFKPGKVLCELCRDVFSKLDVFMWVAKKSGTAGKRGDTSGTLICANFDCSHNVRVPPAETEMYPDPQVIVDRQVAGLQERAVRFVSRIAAG